MKSFYEYTRNILNEKSDEKNPFFNYDEDGDKVGLNVDKLNSIELEDGKLIYDGKPIKDKYLIEIRKDSSYNAWKKKNKDNKKDIISSISKIKEQTTDRNDDFDGGSDSKGSGTNIKTGTDRIRLFGKALTIRMGFYTAHSVKKSNNQDADFNKTIHDVMDNCADDSFKDIYNIDELVEKMTILDVVKNLPDKVEEKKKWLENFDEQFDAIDREIKKNYKTNYEKTLKEYWTALDEGIKEGRETLESTDAEKLVDPITKKPLHGKITGKVVSVINGAKKSITDGINKAADRDIKNLDDLVLKTGAKLLKGIFGVSGLISGLIQGSFRDITKGIKNDASSAPKKTNKENKQDIDNLAKEFEKNKDEILAKPAENEEEPNEEVNEEPKEEQKKDIKDSLNLVLQNVLLQEAKDEPKLSDARIAFDKKLKSLIANLYATAYFQLKNTTDLVNGKSSKKVGEIEIKDDKYLLCYYDENNKILEDSNNLYVIKLLSEYFDSYENFTNLYNKILKYDQLWQNMKLSDNIIVKYGTLGSVKSFVNFLESLDIEDDNVRQCTLNLIEIFDKNNFINITESANFNGTMKKICDIFNKAKNAKDNLNIPSVKPAELSNEKDSLKLVSGFKDNTKEETSEENNDNELNDIYSKVDDLDKDYDEVNKDLQLKDLNTAFDSMNGKLDTLWDNVKSELEKRKKGDTIKTIESETEGNDVFAKTIRLQQALDVLKGK